MALLSLPMFCAERSAATLNNAFATKIPIVVLVDNGSHNGTWHDGTLLIPGRDTPLFERASLRFGDVMATFLHFKAFNRFIMDWLARHSRGSQSYASEGGLTRGG